MKTTRITAMAVAALLITASCSNESLNPESVLADAAVERNEFDNWLMENYTKPYNIDFIYRYTDRETDNFYNVVPADYGKSKALAALVKHVWLDAYAEAMGEDFIRTYSPRVMQLIGSAEYSSSGSMVLGTAEGGLKITLFRVNSLDPDNIWIDQESAFPETAKTPMDLNYWFFHTMHHEFCHILTQKKNYSTDFQTVSAGKYQTTNWINVDDSEAPAMGFTSGYGSGEYNEDFAEIYSFYVTHTQQAWEKLLGEGVVPKENADGSPVYKTDGKGNAVYKKDAAGKLIAKTDAKGDTVYQKDPATGGTLYDKDGNPAVEYEKEIEYDTSGRDAILAKFNILYDYFLGSWDVDLDDLRAIVLRRSEEAKTLDLKNLK